MAEPEGRIVVSGLTKQFRKVRAVDDLSFTVEPGTVTGFLGPNGAGKTTTLRMLLGLITPDGGHRHDRRLPVRRPAATRWARSAPRWRRPASTRAVPAGTTCG